MMHDLRCGGFSKLGSPCTKTSRHALFHYVICDARTQGLSSYYSFAARLFIQIHHAQPRCRPYGAHVLVQVNAIVHKEAPRELSTIIDNARLRPAGKATKPQKGLRHTFLTSETSRTPGIMWPLNLWPESWSACRGSSSEARWPADKAPQRGNGRLQAHVVCSIWFKERIHALQFATCLATIREDFKDALKLSQQAPIGMMASTEQPCSRPRLV